MGLTDFGRDVKKRLIELGMTQRELAEKIGTSSQYLNAILNGRKTGEKYVPKIIQFMDEEK